MCNIKGTTAFNDKGEIMDNFQREEIMDIDKINFPDITEKNINFNYMIVRVIKILKCYQIYVIK